MCLTLRRRLSSLILNCCCLYMAIHEVDTGTYVRATSYLLRDNMKNFASTPINSVFHVVLPRNIYTIKRYVHAWYLVLDGWRYGEDQVFILLLLYQCLVISPARKQAQQQ